MKLKHIQRLTLTLVVLLLAAATQLQAQSKIRYVDSERILADYSEAQEIQKQLDDLRRGYEEEFAKIEQEAKKLADEIQSQGLLLSPEKKAEKEALLQNKLKEREDFYVAKLGPQGDFFRRNQDLQKPLIDKIMQVIEKVGEEEGYDFILDAAGGGQVLYKKEEFDITPRVLEELSKTQ